MNVLDKSTISPDLVGVLAEHHPRRVALERAVACVGRLDSIHNADDVVTAAECFYAFLQKAPTKRRRPPKKRGRGRPPKAK